MHFTSSVGFVGGWGWNLEIICVPSLIVPAGKQNSIFFYINSSCESVTEEKEKKYIVSGTGLPQGGELAYLLRQNIH